MGIERVGNTSVTWRYRIFRPAEEEAAAKARIVTVNVDMDSFEKRPVPDWLRQRLEVYAGF